MKKTEIAGYFLFIVGLVLKLLHIPLNAWIIMAALVILLVCYVAGLVSKKTPPEKALSGIAAVAWLTLFLFLAKFYPFHLGIFAIAILALAVALISRLKNKAEADPQAKILLASMVLSLTVFFTPTDVRYKIFNIKFHHNLSNDYITMDKYSWFLYQAGKFNEAEKFSNDAAESAKRNNDTGFVKIANTHREKIRAKNWEAFSLKKTKNK